MKRSTTSSSGCPTARLRVVAVRLPVYADYSALTKSDSDSPGAYMSINPTTHDNSIDAYMQRLDWIIPGYHMHEQACMHNFRPHASKAEAFVHMHARTRG